MTLRHTGAWEIGSFCWDPEILTRMDRNHWYTLSLKLLSYNQTRSCSRGQQISRDQRPLPRGLRLPLHLSQKRKGIRHDLVCQRTRTVESSRHTSYFQRTLNGSLPPTRNEGNTCPTGGCVNLERPTSCSSVVGPTCRDSRLKPEVVTHTWNRDSHLKSETSQAWHVSWLTSTVCVRCESSLTTEASDRLQTWVTRRGTGHTDSLSLSLSLSLSHTHTHTHTHTIEKEGKRDNVLLISSLLFVTSGLGCKRRESRQEARNLSFLNTLVYQKCGVERPLDWPIVLCR